MIHKAWSNVEEVPYCFSRSSVKFQGHTAKKKLLILTQIGHFRTVAPVWIHQWLQNYAKSLKWHRRGAGLFFGVIHQISRSHGLKNQWFESNLSKITRPVAAIKSLRFALFLGVLSGLLFFPAVVPRDIRVCGFLCCWLSVGGGVGGVLVWSLGWVFSGCGLRLLRLLSFVVFCLAVG